MTSIKTSTVAVLALIAVGTAFIVLRSRPATEWGAAVGSGVVNAGAGVVLGIGDAVGIPRTDMTECQRALAEGRRWDASFACPAGTFIGSFF